MTDAGRSTLANEEMGRAAACLAEARLLESAGLPYGAASRAYYAVFHGSRALLASIGVEAKTHRGVIGQLGEHFVRTGLLDSALGRLLSRMQRDREDADYTTGAVFTGVEATAAIRDAERFLHAVGDLLG